MRVFYNGEGSTSKQKESPLWPNKQAVLWKKIKKFIHKGYITPTLLKFNSLIKYLAVPKSVINDVVQEWWIVFHAGANKLNGCVWCPSFSLPKVISLLWIVEEGMLMSNCDMVEGI